MLTNSVKRKMSGLLLFLVLLPLSYVPHTSANTADHGMHFLKGWGVGTGRGRGTWKGEGEKGWGVGRGNWKGGCGKGKCWKAGWGKRWFGCLFVYGVNLPNTAEQQPKKTKKNK